MTSEKTLPDLPEFDTIADLMISEGVLTLSPAELHGLMAGQLSAGARFDTDTLLKVLCELMNVNQLTDEKATLVFGSLYQITLAQLLDEDLGFRLLLPDDDQEISQRVDALSSWCSGFLAGFGMYLGEQSMSDALREGLQDFAEIAQVSTDPDELDDEDESGLLELQEYVRMAALYIFAECNPDVDPDPADKRKQLH
ncbi:UPF0149 family protein [Nitrincola sp.]|uniref:UPF0149 family protein n=1 Tax=Nitrincola sp. TaxID=1926584 RepID=UPI003A8F8429